MSNKTAASVVLMLLGLLVLARADGIDKQFDDGGGAISNPGAPMIAPAQCGGTIDLSKGCIIPGVGP